MQDKFQHEKIRECQVTKPVQFSVAQLFRLALRAIQILMGASYVIFGYDCLNAFFFFLVFLQVKPAVGQALIISIKFLPPIPMKHIFK